MTTNQSVPLIAAQQRRRFFTLLLMLGGIGLIVAGVAFVGGTILEEQDSFCASCHTVPETTYFERTTALLADTSAPISDLATQHYHLNDTFQCIQCHRGTASLSDRIQTLALGARDTLIMVSGKADPTIEKSTVEQSVLVNAACVGCHETTLLTFNGIQNHFHNFLPQTGELLAQGKQMVGVQGGGGFRTFNNIPLTCTSCHLAHKSVSADADPRLKFMDVPMAQQACDTCHQMGGGEGAEGGNSDD
jgi:hypothetical protein